MRHRINRKTAVPLRRWLTEADSGMTILELLIAALIGLLVVGAALDGYLTMHTQSVLQDSVNEMQQSGRAAMQELSRQIRMAGYGLPPTLASLAGTNSNPDTITVTYESPDGCEVGTTRAMTSVSDNLECAGADLSCFGTNMWVYVFDPVSNVGEFFQVGGLLSSPAALRPAVSLSRMYPSGARVSHIERFSFYINRADSLHPMLMEQPLSGQPAPYAENIEDFQCSYIMKSGDTAQTPTTPSLVRRVLIHLVARTARIDQDLEKNYHRRTYTFQVSVRNQE